MFGPHEDDFVSSQSVRFRRRALNGFMRGLYWSRAGAAYLRMSRAAGAIILCYHSVPGPDASAYIDPYNRLEIEAFEKQMAFLAARRTVISLDELAEYLRKGRTAPAKTVVLTFDDGYLDTLEVVAPILKRYGFPATLYLPTGWIDEARVTWADRVYTTFKTRCRHQYRDSAVAPQSFDLTTRLGRLSAHAALVQAILRADRPTRDGMLDRLDAQLEPKEGAPRLLMTWDDVRRLSTEFPEWTLGLHATHHLDMTQQSLGIVEEEIAACMRTFRHQLGMPARHFAYPYGHHDGTVRTLVRRAGFETAAAGAPPMFRVEAGADRFSLPRISVPASRSLFRFWTSGAYPGLPLKLVRRA